MTQTNLGNSVDNIQITENVLSEEEHKQLLDYALAVDSWETQPWGVKFVVPAEMPRAIVQILDKVFANAHEKCTHVYNAKLYPFKKNQVPLIKFENGYRMNEHADTAGDFAAIYYLNDNYSGGEIHFMDHGLKIKPKANSFVTFPSNSDYWHEVLENTGAERYSATLWFKFDGSSIERPKSGLTR
jgi:hypothetical protein